MPVGSLNGADLYWQDTGETGLPVLLCLHSLAFDHRMFDAQAADFAGYYRVVRPDFRGQGRSSAPGRGPVHLETCAEDVIALIERLGLQDIHIFGQSMGGDVALRLALKRPDRVASLIFAGASACAEDPANRPKFRMSQYVVQLFGARPVLGSTLKIMFGKSFRSSAAGRNLLAKWRARFAAGPRALHRAIAGVIDRASVENQLSKIVVPALVFSGLEDEARPPAWSRALADGLRNARLIRLPYVGHSPAIEAPNRINPIIRAFIDDTVSSNEEENRRP